MQPAMVAFFASDANALRAAVQADPEVLHLRVGDNTLLELATQPGVGPISEDIIAVLIDGGAQLNRALNLAGCWNLPSLAQQLLDGGADPAARADADITPLESAAFHGSTEVADVLVRYGVHRRTLWLAAASGQLDLVKSWVDSSGVLLRPPGNYRPNFADVGRPEGSPATEDPNDILGEAFVFAAANDRVVVVDYLHAAGVDVDSRPYRNTTALHLAVQFHKLQIVRHLLALGASREILDDQYRSNATGWSIACDDGTDVAAEIRSVLDDS